MEKKYLSIVELTEAYLEKHGDTYLGVGWTKKQEYADRRYQIMLDLINPSVDTPVQLLDFGCGASHLYEYMLKHPRYQFIQYSGLDLSDKFMALSTSKFPQINYYHLDIFDETVQLPIFDYVILNGIFTSKGTLTFDEMVVYQQRLLRRIFPYARRGIAFNVISKQVEWERDDLFHLPMDTIATFLAKELSRDFMIRHDYGLYEYTVYLYQPGVNYEA